MAAATWRGWYVHSRQTAARLGPGQARRRPAGAGRFISRAPACDRRRSRTACGTWRRSAAAPASRPPCCMTRSCVRTRTPRSPRCTSSAAGPSAPSGSGKARRPAAWRRCAAAGAALAPTLPVGRVRPRPHPHCLGASRGCPAHIRSQQLAGRQPANCDLRLKQLPPCLRRPGRAPAGDQAHPAGHGARQQRAGGEPSGTGAAGRRAEEQAEGSMRSMSKLQGIRRLEDAMVELLTLGSPRALGAAAGDERG